MSPDTKQLNYAWHSVLDKAEVSQDQQLERRQRISTWPAPQKGLRPTPRGVKQESHEDGFMTFYSGPEGDFTPRALLCDNRLTPLECKLWQVLRMFMADQQASAPRYQDLQPFLSQTPCGQSAGSRDSVARAFAILRMTGWLTLTARGRDTITGRVLGNMYTLHGSAISPAEHAVLDPSYTELVEKNLTHHIKAVRIVASNVIEEIRAQAESGETRLPLRLETLMQNMESNIAGSRAWQESGLGKNSEVRNPDSAKTAQSGIRTLRKQPSPESGLSENSPVRNPDSVEKNPSPESGPCSKATEINGVRNPDSYSTCTVLHTYVRTVLYRDHTGKTERHQIKWPSELDRFIFDDDRISAMRMMEHLEPTVQEQVLHALAYSCLQKTLHSPVGYLKGMVLAAERGEFKPRIRGYRSPHAATKHSPPPQKTATAAVRKQADIVSPMEVPEFKNILEQFGSRKVENQDDSNITAPEVSNA
ncbi:MAG: STY4528 family pathogenicity island replication protein [Thiopseudomonas sp.]